MTHGPTDDAICWAFIRCATGKRLANRLPKLSLVTAVGDQCFQQKKRRFFGQCSYVYVGAGSELEFGLGLGLELSI